jgi:hypothetical protein
MAVVEQIRRPSALAQRLSREEVILIFRAMLGRDPKDEQAIEYHRLDRPEALGTYLMRTPEFAARYIRLIQK